MKLYFIDIETTISDGLNINKQEFFDKRADGDPERLTNNAALYPEIGKIKAIGVSNGTDTKVLLGTEKEILEKFLLIPEGIFIGWNIKKFDIPFIIKKCISYGLILTSLRMYGEKKPRETPCIDLMEVWSMGSGFTSLSSCCEMLNLPNPKDNGNGKDVKNMDDGQLTKYLTGDVEAIVNIYNIFTKTNFIMQK